MIFQIPAAQHLFLLNKSQDNIRHTKQFQQQTQELLPFIVQPLVKADTLLIIEKFLVKLEGCASKIKDKN